MECVSEKGKRGKSKQTKQEKCCLFLLLSFSGWEIDFLYTCLWLFLFCFLRSRLYVLYMNK